MNAVERNIVFLYPISKVLQELKEKLEEDDTYIIYELDAVNEYTQIIGVLEHSVTFSSDLKKTEQYLETAKSFIKNKNTRNIILQERVMLPHIFSKYQKLGLNEQMKEETPVKNILHKINVFFNVFDQQLKKEEEEKNKAITDLSHSFHFDNQKKINKSKVDSNEKLHVEKMAIIDDGLEEKKPRQSFDLSAINQNIVGTSKMGGKKTNLGFMNSMFDNVQRKNVMQFNPTTDLPKLKTVDFQPVDQELKRKSVNTFLPIVNEEAKKRKKLNLDGIDNERERKKFEEVDRDLNQRRGKFEPVEKDLSRKRKLFEEQLRELGNRKNLDFNPVDQEGKKNQDFTPIEREVNQRRAKFDPIQNQLDRKKLDLEEIEREIQRKKNDFGESNSKEKDKVKWEELHELNRKRAKLLDELEDEQKNANKFLKEELEGLKRKKLELDELDLDQKKADFQEVDIDLNKKKHDFEEYSKDNEKKTLNLEDVDLEKKRKNFNEVEIDHEKKSGQIDELDIEQKKHTQLEEIENENTKKSMLNIAIDTNKTLRSNEQIQLDREEYEKNLVYDQNENLDEQILDYSKLKKSKRTGVSQEVDDDLPEDIRAKILENLEEPELKFFESKTFGLEFLVFFNHFLLQSDIQISKLCKFIHFAFIKEYHADLSLYVNTVGVQENINVSAMYKLYEGHIEAQTVFPSEEYKKLKAQNETLWGTINLPTWEDNTFQLEPNSFIYPYYQDGVHLGFAVVHFKLKLEGHEQAKEVESLLMMLKGTIFAALKEGA